jgi:hypothetical protein
MQVKPTQQKEEYFARLEFERRREVLSERETHPEEERQLLLAIGQGRCPKCAAELVPVLYRGVELDKCSRCQGVWLDFAELDQMIAEDTGFRGSVRRIFT